MNRIRALFLLLVTTSVVGTILSAQPTRSLDVEYREAAGRLIGAALVDDNGYEKLAYLTTRIGHRLSGSTGLERATAWVAEQMKAGGLENVRTQPVKVPHWVRGNESAEVVKPLRRTLNMLGLGRSVSTPREGITAPVVVVGSFDDLEKVGADKVKGKIVLYDVTWQGYGPTVAYRNFGASRAARLGAVATLLRSITPRSLYSPHTGALAYETGSPQIPAAAITVEDAAWIRQMTAMGDEVHVQLKMDAQTLPDADSSNVMGEIVGRERPDEIVVIGGHIDSWDVGQGAHDDGAGVVAAWRAVTLMKELGLRPRRTIRAVA